MPDTRIVESYLNRLKAALSERGLEAGSGLTWCWVWNPLRPAERGAATPEPEIEPMCEAADITRAAYLIANVVRLREEQPARDGDDA
jgi:hypothetical protein